MDRIAALGIRFFRIATLLALPLIAHATSALRWQELKARVANVLGLLGATKSDLSFWGKVVVGCCAKGGYSRSFQLH